jgi:hypothetical protein
MVGLGRDGILRFIRYMLPGLVIDFGAMLFPNMTKNYLSCVLVGLAASSTSFVFSLIGDWLVGMDPAVMVTHSLINAFGNMVFGTAGSLFVPPVMRKLSAHGIIT